MKARDCATSPWSNGAPFRFLPMGTGPSKGSPSVPQTMPILPRSLWLLLRQCFLNNLQAMITFQIILINCIALVIIGAILTPRK